jgi:hypothetical protein
VPEPRALSLALVALRIAVAMLLVAGVGWIAHLPLGEPAAGAAMRVALRTPLAQVEICRDRPAEELAALPVHMRQPRICEVTTIDYRLRVVVDDRIVVDRLLAHRGVRKNRPLVADETVALAPGIHRVVVRFEPESEIPAGADGPPLATALFDAEVELEPGRVRLLALADDGASFRLGG